MIITAAAALLPGHQHYTEHLVAKMTKAVEPVQVASSDLVSYIIVVLVMLLMLIWMVVLMYRAFAVSCNVSRGKAIGTFIGALIIGEILSKVLILRIVPT
ncbi:MAG: hypothetical protein QGI83_16755 [Candidatus Latescibacteria bacterium]|jgi:hypothetical protein|nr:hypothetical protein [Candidatus Latescibacterota bacterium]